MRIRTRKAKSAGGAAALVALVGLFIILYVLFLPADIREELLDDDLDPYDDNNKTNNNDNDTEYRLILSESPGRLDVLDITDCRGKECSHEITSFMLFKTTDSAEIEGYNPFVLKNNVMTKKFHTEVFEVMDLENTEDVFLAFNSYKHDGILTIKLNGNIIYEKDLDTFNPDPIELPDGMLARTNRLEFSISSVGWKFWKTNEYQIENMKIIGDITDISKQKSRNMFYVTNSEFYNAERARLKFSPDCNQATAGMLQIMLNSRELYYGVPDCQLLNVIEFAPAYLEKGENLLTFNTDGGTYMIDLVEIRTDLRDITYPVYYFDIKEEELEWIEDDDANLTIKVEFVDENVKGIYDPDYEEYVGDEEYRIIMTVNGHKKYISTYNEKYERSVALDVLREDDNWVKLEPRGSMVDVARLIVEITPIE